MGAALPRRHPRATRAPHTIAVSAPTLEGLTATAHVLHSAAYRWLNPADLARTQAAREHGPVRAAVVAYDTGQALEGLRALQQQRPNQWAIGPRLTSPGHRHLVHLFGDAAPLPAGAAGALLRTREGAQAVQAARTALAPHVPDPVWEPGRRPTGPAQVHQATFVIQWALHQSLITQGLVPDVVVGHGQGELTACAATGRMSLAEAARVVAERSHALAALTTPHLLEVSATPAQVEAFTDEAGTGVRVTTVYHPGRALVRLDASAAAALRRLRAQPGTRVAEAASVDAAHTHDARPAAAALAHHLGPVRRAPGHTPLVPTSEHPRPARFDAAYWAHQVAATRQVDHALDRACRGDPATIVALGPQELSGPLAQTLGPEHITTALTGAGQADARAWADLFASGHWLGPALHRAEPPGPEQARAWAERALCQATGRHPAMLAATTWHSCGAGGQDLARLLTDLRQIPAWARLRAQDVDNDQPLAEGLNQWAAALPTTGPAQLEGP